MLRVEKVIPRDFEEYMRANCTGGHGYTGSVVMETGEEFSFYTCACHAGCMGKDRVPEVGYIFLNVDKVVEYMYSELE